ncbi:hypothetical protein RHMOL_Rhmol03G0233800 [Rhododendron molle]|uniref:Uncharacterized protein n=2 Tax=Rhododendron molle TaxID=49168 RepID=A0ACC0PHN6_RHOML|nr:hypothetical protein RHMOL_Rhmol03G0233800 [Rhododendron molle]
MRGIQDIIRKALSSMMPRQSYIKLSQSSLISIEQQINMRTTLLEWMPSRMIILLSGLDQAPISIREYLI